MLLDIGEILSQAHIGHAMKVADLGCGSSGFFVFSTASLVGKPGKVYAVDILKPVVEGIMRRAKLEHNKNIEAIWSNLEVFNATKIDSGSLDVAMLINTLHQSPKRVDILREAVRMIKKGGKLVVVDWMNISLPFGPDRDERVNKDNLIQACQKLGLELSKEFRAGDYHFGLIFTKI